ncbi:tetratricopeptide repeat protein [Pyxidicoccus fallax]|uniref:Tetratricopeptide repeat protein n=1 Tax=Pyxidicoccus fallax TaxID=394095 RepID=A0A848LB37_9BACT|nr:tetratricopeptide repeat protein [Pyxidicoccus fallax]NMO13521.1 tetratricopeptide repeat protein [Pyxidicoccus fallax]NPC78528.1 tetratricopeptide repeat protein [Pyxidicoccus fallax]
MNRHLPLLLLLLGLPAWATPTGIELYERGEYEAAVQGFQQSLEAPELSSEKRGLMRVYLAASLYALGRVDQAREHLELLAREHPEQRVDPVRFRPELVGMADIVRQRVEAEQAFAARAAEIERRAQEEALRSRPRASLHLRPEAVGLYESMARDWTVGAGLAYQRQWLECGFRVMLGAAPVLNVQGGVLLGDRRMKALLGLRASLVPGLDSHGAGPLAGARFALPAGLVALADVSGEYFFLGRKDRYRFAVTAQAGLGFGFDLQLP